MIERLIKEEKLQPLDKGVVTNLAVLADGVKGLSYDPDNTYSAPYFWGTVGIVSVSYTHLDVYKRQGYVCCIKMRSFRIENAA